MSGIFCEEEKNKIMSAFVDFVQIVFSISGPLKLIMRTTPLLVYLHEG